jgi:hypothetical protein
MMLRNCGKEGAMPWEIQEEAFSGVLRFYERR